MIQYLRYLLALSFFCIFLEGTAQAQDFSTTEKLSLISKEDYVILDQLFRALIFENYFAYTLFGSKPMTHKGAFYNDEEPKPDHLSLPYFAVFGNDPETDTLRKIYEQERKHILSLYSKGNFLEITLTQLLAP